MNGAVDTASLYCYAITLLVVLGPLSVVALPAEASSLILTNKATFTSTGFVPTSTTILASSFSATVPFATLLMGSNTLSETTPSLSPSTSSSVPASAAIRASALPTTDPFFTMSMDNDAVSGSIISLSPPLTSTPEILESVNNATFPALTTIMGSGGITPTTIVGIVVMLAMFSAVLAAMLCFGYQCCCRGTRPPPSPATPMQPLVPKSRHSSSQILTLPIPTPGGSTTTAAAAPQIVATISPVGYGVAALGMQPPLPRRPPVVVVHTRGRPRMPLVENFQ